ncbi:uncharacterized protein [Chiloscyllium punctatum]|uniref:uncharacterized protein n=1 Tax=Chiloscyllium punctatum TaxID=137246 RepID=UPI003B63723E
MSNYSKTWDSNLLGNIVSHSYVDDWCYDVSARHECWEGGRPYYQVYNKGYGGKIRGCPINDRWVCISKTGRWDLSSVLRREQVDRVKETKIQITDRGLEKEQDRQGTVVLSKVPSVYEEVEERIELPDVTQNLFIDLTSRIATVLNISNCWVCGGPHMSEQWPWTGHSLDIWELLQTTWTHVNERKSQGWRLTNSPEGQLCVEGKGTVEVGISPCQSILDATTRVWWPEDITWYIANRGHQNCVPLRTDSSSDELGADSSDDMMRAWGGGCQGSRCWDTPVQTLARGQEPEYWNCSGPGPYEGVPGVKELWDDVVRQGGPAPDVLFWICAIMIPQSGKEIQKKRNISVGLNLLCVNPPQSLSTREDCTCVVQQLAPYKVGGHTCVLRTIAPNKDGGVHEGLSPFEAFSYLL